MALDKKNTSELSNKTSRQISKLDSLNMVQINRQTSKIENLNKIQMNRQIYWVDILTKSRQIDRKKNHVILGFF